MTHAGHSLVAMSTVDDRWRWASVAAGPFAIVAGALFVVSVVTSGGDESAMLTSPIAVASTAVGLVALLLVGLALVSVAVRFPSLRSGFGLFAWLTAATGTALVGGGQWAQLFVLPGLATAAPDVAGNGIGSVTAGYLVSFAVLAAGGVMLGIALLRGGASRAGAIVAIAGGVVCIVPLPVRFVVLAIAFSMIGRRD